MYNDLPGHRQEFEFEEYADNLLEQGLQVSPSELHGCLCGVLAAGTAPGAEAGLAALNQVLDVDLHGELADQVMQLFVLTSASLQDEEFNFNPLLPGDDVDLDERTTCLAAWCRGFLAGYAHSTAVAGRPAEAIPAQSGEILRDLAAIVQAEAGETLDEEEQEEAERNFVEIVEYVRFGALNIYTDTAVTPAGDNSSGHTAPPLH